MPNPRSIISAVLVITLVLQSLIAAADAHQASHAGPQHVTDKHEHSHTPSPATQSLIAFNDLSEAESFDCHHCCHGASSMQLPLAFRADSGLMIGPQNAQFSYSFYANTVNLPPEDRPPIFSLFI